MWSAGAAHACTCDAISPEAGFDRAQYVFTGKVIRADQHAWLIEVERVWKGGERLARTIKLMDVYATLPCEFFFQPGQRYVFFAILAKGGKRCFITRKPATGRDPCSRRACPSRATSRYGSRISSRASTARESSPAPTSPKGRGEASADAVQRDRVELSSHTPTISAAGTPGPASGYWSATPPKYAGRHSASRPGSSARSDRTSACPA